MLQALDSQERTGVFISTDREKLLTDGVALELKPVCSLKVLVKDVGGNPLEGAEVNLFTLWARAGVFRPVGMTDAAGKVTLDGLCVGGSYQVTARLGGYSPVGGDWKSIVSVGSPEWSRTVELAMEPATRVQKGKLVIKDLVDGKTTTFELFKSNAGVAARVWVLVLCLVVALPLAYLLVRRARLGRR